MTKRYKKDPRYIGVPNINFSLCDKKDSREAEYSKQRKQRGFDNSELWSLTNTIASFVIPRLKAFIEFDKDVNLNPHTEVYNKILVALELINRDDGAWTFTDEENLDVENGLNLFSEYFTSLWI